MSEYIKRIWADGEVITTEKMNNIETGIAESKKEAAQAKAASDGKAPAPIISQTDITAGTTPLATGQSYHVYK